MNKREKRRSSHERALFESGLFFQRVEDNRKKFDRKKKYANKQKHQNFLEDSED